jgi:2,4-dienoyl-CoA reductase (NADPH2)
MAYEHLLSPLTLGSLTLPNRVVMGSMHTGLEDDPDDAPALAAYFAERARGGAGLIVTGAYAVNAEGRLGEGGGDFTSRADLPRHRQVTDAVHEAGGRIACQLLHAGRYAKQASCVGPSSIKSPINRYQPRALTSDEVWGVVADFAASAALAVEAGYDAIEVMGSEGYLLNQFLAARTNDRTDEWGGSPYRRMRLPIEVVRRVRETVGTDFPVIYRISLVDLVEDGQTWEETVELAQALVEAGVTAFNTGIGWHEAQIPTIITQVPRGAWVDYTERLKAAVDVPVCASNRINTPELAEEIVARGAADLVSMARPLLADPYFVAKAADDRADEINTCIACNQACLDHGFSGLKATCLVNPRACNETTLVVEPLTLGPTRTARTAAVVGAGPAGLSAAVTLAERGFAVTLFEREEQLGGQFRLAMTIPGKEDFADSLRSFSRRLEVLGVELRLGTEANAADLATYDEVIVATGVTPRVPAIEGIDHDSVVSYADVLRGSAVPGKRVAVIGAGGIGVDLCHWLTHDPTEDMASWKARWGVDPTFTRRGGLTEPTAHARVREVTLLQRKTTPIGIGLGKTSGWAHRLVMRRAGVRLVSGATYDRVDTAPDGSAALHYSVDGQPRVLEVDTVVVCAGQVSVRSLYDELCAAGASAHLIGGADVAAELDAKRAIDQGTRLAAAL